MKSKLNFVRTLLVLLILSTSACHAKTTGETDSTAIQKPFDFLVYRGASRRVNVNLAIHQSKPVIVTLKNTRNAVMHRSYLKPSPNAYRLKFDFEDAPSGLYQLEISDGRQTTVRQIEVIDLPAIESQRYIVYNPQTSR
ncbi:hypothetical protein GCM10027299_14910 [Larkinella ripae]